MSKNLLFAIGICLAFTLGAPGQTPAAAPTFDVASIKPSAPVTPAMAASGKIHAGLKITANRVDIGMFSLTDLICKAYDVKQYQVSGPDWMGAQRFDIVANLPEGATKEQVPQMLQTLLADRFKLTIHRDKKEHAVYALVVGKGGLKMKESEKDPNAPQSAATGSGSSEVTLSRGPKGAIVSDGEGGQTKMTMGADGKTMHLETSKMSMAKMAEALSRFVDRPVVDMTELKGDYQVALDLSMQDMLDAARRAGAPVPPGPGPRGRDAGALADAASDPSGGSVFASIQALGLKLEPRKSSIDLIVIDHAEKMPTEN
jgi:uncharacterized protein (TIGR03435 family)